MRNMRALRIAPIAVPVLLVLAATTAQAEGQVTSARGIAALAVRTAPRTQAPLTVAGVRALSRHVSDKVIIVLRNQLPRIPDSPADAARRVAAVRSLQRGILAELAATHARGIKSITLINAITATVSRGEASRLAANPAVASVVRDMRIPLASPAPRPAHSAKGITPLPGACLPGGKVQLNPEALGNINAASQDSSALSVKRDPATTTTAQGLGYTGAGVTVGFIADGLDINNPDFVRKNGKHVFVDYQDFSGTGTSAPTIGGEAFLDASSIAAQGLHTYNVASYGAGLSKPCDIRILGVAPGASLVGLNVFGSSEFAFNSVFLEAINYAVTKDKVKVLNESFGANPFPDTASLDLTRMADDAAVKAGVTVVVSSGDAGVTSTIGSPATDPSVISVGATTTLRAYAQTGVAGITTPGVKGWIDNNISGLSSAGFDQAGGTVDVVAPGDSNWALCTPKPAHYAACTNFAGKPASVELAGGTSEAAPLTAGVAALVIQAYAKTHKGHDPTPAQVKDFIVSTAQDIGAPGEQQGAGLLDAFQAVRAAAEAGGSVKAIPLKNAGDPLLDGSTQFNAVDATSTPQTFSETLANAGPTSVKVGLSGRTLSPYTSVSALPLNLTKLKGFKQIVHFTVGPGRARLNVSVSAAGFIELILIGPGGQYAGFNIPQGVSNYANYQVSSPKQGAWEAVVAVSPTSPTVPKAVTAAFQASVATWQPFGVLSAHSLTIAAGRTGKFTLTVPTPSQPGDEAGSIVVTSSATTPAFANVTTIPVTLRALAPAPSPTTTFAGTLTGGNGRSPAAGQTAYYQVKVPSGLQALNVQVTTGSSGNTMLAELVDPSGIAASSATSGLLATSPTGNSEIVPEDGAQLHVLNPQAGTWTLIIDFYNTVSGTAVSQPFTVSMNDTPVSASVSNLPTMDDNFVDPGTPIEVDVTVTNGGSTPEAYFVDARTGSQVSEKLAPQTVSDLVLPNLFGVVPTFLVPSHTSLLSASASASKPLLFDYAYTFGDPDLISSTGTSAGGQVHPDIPAGDWTITPFLKGPDGKKGPASVLARVGMTVQTLGFARQFASPTGDLWEGSNNLASGFTPYVVNPGSSVTIPVILTPEGSPGQIFSGTVYVADSSVAPGFVTFDELPFNALQGSDVAAFPFAYQINGP
jgi:Subtilase family